MELAGATRKERTDVDEPRFWMRFGRWFRRPDRSLEHGHDVSVLDAPGLPPAADPGRTSAESPVVGAVTGNLSKLRASRSGSQLERLEREYARVVNLIEAVQKHMASQGERSDAMVCSLEKLVEGLAHVPAASQDQLKLLTSISEAVTADAACSARLEEGLSQLPQIADAQREAIVSIDRHLGESRESNEHLVSILDGHRETISELSDATGASAKALQDLRWDTASRDERVAKLLSEQTRRLTIFAVSAITLAAVAAIVALIGLLR